MADFDYKTPRIHARFPDLAGQSAIVTGASRGIGCGIAEFLGRQGMKLTLAARSEAEGLAFTAQLVAAGVDCQWVTADLATPAGAQQTFDAAMTKYGQIDLLVNNAAIVWSPSILELDEKAYKQTFEDNVRIVYGLCHLRRPPHGRAERPAASSTSPASAACAATRGRRV